MKKMEKTLLEKCKAGLLDGRVGDFFETDGGSTVWTVIADGIATKMKQGPTRKYFDGKENVKVEGVLKVLETWKTDDELLQFFQKFGWLMKDPDAKAYSKLFKGKK